MSDIWDEFSDADLHIVELIRAAKFGRCVEHDRHLFAEYNNEVSDYAQFTFCSLDEQG